MDEMMERQNPFCVISKEGYGEHDRHDIQTNDSWLENPYGDEYATVPDEMVPGIQTTGGYCDIVLTKDGKEVASYTAREKPEPTPKPEPEPEEPVEPGETLADRVSAVEADLADLTAAVEKGLSL